MRTLQNPALEDFVDSHLCKLLLRDRAHYWVCVRVKGIGRRLPLELRSLYKYFFPGTLYINTSTTWYMGLHVVDQVFLPGIVPVEEKTTGTCRVGLGL